MGLLIAYPWLAAAIGGALLVPALRHRDRRVMTIAVLWLLYAAYETGMKRRWLCSGECNIRVDLLLIYPVLLLSLVMATVRLLRPSRAPTAG
ncbi:MAG TPA: hypothetical protein VLE53_17635 [Gemmatimonadaceae bacterium]|nr:hypothetical protein [Gemmatimonadaceae bacterium]